MLMMSSRVMAGHFRFSNLDLRLIAAILLLASGCAPTSLQEPMRLSTEAWTGAGRGAQRIHTAHYTINTTVQEEEFNEQLAAVMEGAWEQYRRLSGVAPASGRR